MKKLELLDFEETRTPVLKATFKYTDGFEARVQDNINRNVYHVALLRNNKVFATIDISDRYDRGWYGTELLPEYIEQLYKPIVTQNPYEELGLTPIEADRVPAELFKRFRVQYPKKDEDTE